MSDAATRPRRIQMRRDRPWRKDHPDAVIVDRRSEWGNPFPMLEDTQAEHQKVVELFRIWSNKSVVRRAWIALNLRGKDLACWCRLCDRHADGLPLGAGARDGGRRHDAGADCRAAGRQHRHRPHRADHHGDRAADREGEEAR